MKTPFHLFALCACLLVACTTSQKSAETDYTQYVNPFIGTDFTGNTIRAHKLRSAWCNSVRTTVCPDGTVFPAISIPTAQSPDSAIHTSRAREQAICTTFRSCPSPCPTRRPKRRWAFRSEERRVGKECRS